MEDKAHLKKTYEISLLQNKYCYKSAITINWTQEPYKQTKLTIINSNARPKTKADNIRMKSILRTVEMIVLRRISGYTVRDRLRNSTIRDAHGISDIVREGRKRRRVCNEQVERMLLNKHSDNHAV